MRTPRHNWDAIRKDFIAGDNTVTLASLAKKFNIPNPVQVRNQASKEDWKKQRQVYREKKQLKGLVVKHDVMEERKIFERVESTEAKLANLIDTAEIITRHLQIGKLLQSKSVKAIKAMDEEKLKPNEIANFVKLSADLEKGAIAMLEGSVDLDSLSKEELEKLANGKS